jgi:hexosaminidase
MKNQIRKFVGVSVLVSLLSLQPSYSIAQQESASSGLLQLIPTPQKILLGQGHFTFTSDTKILLGNPKDEEDLFAVSQLSAELQAELRVHPAFTKTLKGKTLVIGQPTRDKLLQGVLKNAGITMPAELGKEGYVLRVSPSQIIIAANSGAGVFYGVQTLKQLLRSNRDGNSIPCLTITDWPALRYRGWMDDISRGPIPSVAFLKEVIKKMAEHKQNFFTLYTEHVFRLKSHPEIAPADGITPEEIADLTSFARNYHIELIGNAQSFGHMENQLRSPFYNVIRENPYVVTPAVEETYRFLKEEYDEIVPSYQSTMFHINCDEVYGLGGGPSKRMVDSMGMPSVYAYHINRINDLIKPYGKRILMWGDIAAQNPDIIPKLPKDLIVISWGYDAVESFDEAIIPFKKTGFDFMVAPGVSCWTEVWPNMSTAVVNISNYVRDGAKLGAMGMMNTAWDDDGENFFTYNWHGLLWGAECSWHPALPLTGEEARKDRDLRLTAFNRSFDGLFFGMSGVTNALFQFDTLRHIPVPGIVRDYGVWSSMLEPDLENPGEPVVLASDRAANNALELIERLMVLKKQVKRNAEVLDYALFAAKRVRFTAEKVLARVALFKTMYMNQGEQVAPMKADLDHLLAELHSLKSDYVGLWQRENRSWWLDRILEKYDRLGNQLVDLDKTVFIEPANALTAGKRTITLWSPFNDQAVYYSTDGSEPTLRSTRYAGPFEIDHSSLIRARVYVDRQPYPLTEKFVLIHKAIGRLYKLNSSYSRYNRAYSAGGQMGLLDGLRGSENFADGRWQGYQGQDLDIIIELQKPTSISNISIGFLQNSFSWILMPERVQIFVSNDPDKFVLAKEILNTVDPKEDGAIIKDFSASFPQLVTRFVKIIARNPGKLPSWHQSAGSDSYIFADEIVVE